MRQFKLLILLLILNQTYCEEQEDLVIQEPPHISDNEAQQYPVTKLTNENFFTEILVSDAWLINICHRYHWECKLYDQTFYNEISQQLTDYASVGYIDLYSWYSFNSNYIQTYKSPQLILIRKQNDIEVPLGYQMMYYEYQGDPSNTQEIIKFIENGYSNIVPKPVPRQVTQLDFVLYCLEGLYEGLTKGTQILLSEVGLGNQNWIVQSIAILFVIWLHYIFVVWASNKLEIKPKSE